MEPPKKHFLHRIDETLIIDKSIEQVWDVLQDFNNVYTWAPAVSHSHGITAQTKGQDCGRRCTIDGLGTVDEKVIEWQEGRGFTFEVTPLGPLDVSQSRWYLHALSPNSTVLTANFTYNLRFGMLGKVLHKLLMRRKLATTFKEALYALKTRVETGQLVRPHLATNEAQVEQSVT
ncbi:hypothetical protein C2869_10965 [Saccharobesus litoralis]|uniref:Polyketide cyclase / dehydrase and lipid transport n=1 Tax=Saccharobesus litoralis TaxID=2172099 RepID=A0A2S0VRU2_9ALTE|nr:SRPBCC family protein [Saccharobesus litoralis]AWB66924.1 hypothetical protein C2869_10965 [Saccharobesus litoralis]